MNKLRGSVRSILAILIALLLLLQSGVMVSANEAANLSAQQMTETSGNQNSDSAVSASSGEQQSGSEAGVQAEDQTEVDAEVQAEDQTDVDAEVQAEAQADVNAEAQAQAQTAEATGSPQTAAQSSGDQSESSSDDVNMPPQYFEQSSGSGIKVVVAAPEGVFPKGTTMSVTDVASDTAIAIAKKSSDTPENVVDASGVDITFNNQDGQEIEPTDGKSVSVKIQLARTLEGENFSIIHDDDKNGPTTISDATDSSAAFQADSFSIYVIDGESPAVATYRFYDSDGNLLTYTADDVTFSEQKIKDGENLYSPANPEKDGYIFKGWTTTQGSDTVELEPFSSITPSVTATQDISYYPVFEEAHYVFFMDSTGDDARVYQTKEGVSGDTITVSDVELSSTGTTSFTAWYTDSSLTTAAGDSVTLGDENIYLYPKFEEGHYLIFKTGDDATIIAPEFVEADAVTTAPDDPERAGYTFVGWSATENSTTADFDFGSELTETTTLHAVWEPASATYTVLFWKQSVTDDKDAADADKTYEYAGSETRTGTTESYASATSSDRAKSSINNGVGFHFNSTNTVSVQIKGDGSTILNIYYDRDTFTYKFYQSNYTLLLSSISGLYGATMDQSGVEWPTDGVWVCHSNGYYYPYLDAFLPVKNFYYYGDSVTISFNKADGYYPLKYYREAVTGGGFTEDLTPQVFYLDSAFTEWNFENVYSGFQVSKFRVMDAYGNYGKWVTVSSDGTVSLSKSAMTSYSGVSSFGGLDIYYSRNQHKIDYYSGNKIVHTESGIYYEASLADYGESGNKYYVPEEAPSTEPEGSVFAGWYKDPECTVPYDFENETMPDDDVIVYAKWEQPTVNAYVYDEMYGGDLVDTITVDYGGTVDENLMPNVINESGEYVVYTSSSETITIPDDATWVGWDIAVTDSDGAVTSYETYSFDTQLTEDIYLYPHYLELNKYHVTYDANGGSGMVTDSRNYAGGDDCYADVLSGSNLTPPDGQVFLYWNTESDGSGTTYYPDDKVQITGDLTLYAIYGDSPEATKLTYYSNYPSAANLTAVTTSQTVDDTSVLVNNQDLTVYTLVEAGMTTPSGYAFVGWNTSADGSGTSYAASATIGVDVEDPQPNELYAIWATEPTKDVFKSTDASTSIDGETVSAGDVLLYKITYSNTTDSDVTVTITDAIPDNSTYVDGSADNDGTYADGKVTWNITVNSGDSITVSFEVTVVANNGTGLSNKATVNDGTNTYTTNETTNPTPTEPTKDVFQSSDTATSIDGDTVEAGDELLYKITYTNTTGSDATVTITDAIPENSTYVDGSVDHDGSYEDGTVTWSDLAVAAGESITVSFKVTVNSNDGTALKNSATVNDGTNTFTTNETINPTGDNPTKDVCESDSEEISIDGDTVSAGDELLYKITYKNTTGADATVTITDTIPENSTYVDGSADNGGTYADGTVTWSDISLASGASITVSFKVTVNANDGTVLTNDADAIVGDNTYTTNVTKNPTPTEPEKDVFDSNDDTTSIDGDTVNAGDELLYKITYTNTTGSDATVTITDAIPENSTYVTGSADNSGTYADGTVTWSNITVANGESITVSFKVTVDENDGTELKNNANVTVGENTYTTNETTNPTPTEPTKDVFQSSDTETSIDGDTVEAGDELLYKITYTNTTGSDATVTITDAIPENSTYVDGSADNSGTYSNGTVTWSDISLASGASMTVSFNVTVDANDGTALTNQAAVSDGTNSYTTNVTTNPTPTKPTKDVFQSSDTATSIDGDTVEADDELLYKITYTNTTGSDATVTITDEIPDNSTYVDGSADNSGTYADGTVTWSNIAVANGASITVSFQVKVAANNGTELKNDANVTVGENTYTTNETTNPTPTEPTKDVFQSSDTSTSINGNTVEAGDELLYKITYTNTTGSDATVTITDAIPENSTYVDGSADNEGTYADGTVTWSDLAVADSESITVSFKVTVDSNDGTALTNQAVVSDGTNSYTTNETTNPTPTEPTKDVFKSSDTSTSIDGDPVNEGDELLYKITYSNTTGSDATVTITDAIPENSSYVTSSADNSGTYSDGTVTWSDLAVATGDSITVSFKVTVDANDGTALTNQAVVSDGTNSYTTNETTNPTTTEPTKDVFNSSDESTSIDGETVESGDELLYKITYTNTTGSDATVTITDAIPENSTYVDGSADNGGTYSNGTVTWSDLAVATGASTTVSFKVTVDEDDGTALKNQAVVNDGTNDYTTNITTNPTGDNPTKDVFQSNDETTSIDGDTVSAGDELLYKITYTNTTGSDATVTITDTIPENSTYVDGSADNDGTYADGTVTWSDIALASDESITVSFKVTVDANAGTELANYADAIVGDNTYTTNVTKNPTPTEPTKDVFESSDETTSIDGDTVSAGDELLYKITYTNTTGSDANVTITDVIPENSTYVDGSVDNGGIYVNGTVTWSDIVLASGESITVSFKVNVDANDGTVLTNQATVKDGTNTYTTNETTNPTPTEPTKDVFNSSDETTSIDGDTVEAGDELLYKITYMNTTGSDATVSITDTIPENSTYVDGSADNDGTYADGTVTWSDITVADGDSITVSFKVTVDEDDGTALKNQAVVNDGTNTYTTNETINPTGKNPTKDVFESSDETTSIDGETVKAGDELLYKITYTNMTGSDATVTITDAIPENSTYVDDSADHDGVYADGTVTWSDIALASGESITVSFKVTVDANDGTELSNYADAIVGDNTYTTNVTTNPTPTEPTKDVYESGDEATSIDGDTVSAGDELLYKITYTNTTGSDATVTITDAIPENSTYVDDSVDHDGSYADGTVTWSDLAVADGESITVSFKVTVDENEGTELTNQAAVSDGTNTFTTNETTNPTPTDPTKDVFDSSDESTSIDDETVEAGDELLYKITYTNTTGSDATVTITDAIPNNSTYVDGSADHDGSYADGTMTWSDLAVAAGESITVSFKVTVDANDGTTLTNQATVDDGTNTYTTNETTNPTPENTTPEEPTQEEPTKDVFKSSDESTSIDGDTVSAGDELLYKITYTNTANSEATVTITDAIPENSTYVDGSADHDGVYADGTVTWSDIALASGESITVSFKVTVDANDGTTLTNQATVDDGSNTYTTNETTNPTSSESVVPVNIDAKKILSGGTLQDGQFSFELRDQSGKTVQTVKNERDGSITFDALSFDQEGTWTYTIREVLPDDEDSSVGGIQKDGVTYDETIYMVIVKVTRNSDTGLLEAAVTCNANGSAIVGDPVFTNKVLQDFETGITSSKTTGGQTSVTKSNPVKTGDDTKANLYRILLLASAAIAAILIVLRRRRKE